MRARGILLSAAALALAAAGPFTQVCRAQANHTARAQEAQSSSTPSSPSAAALDVTPFPNLASEAAETVPPSATESSSLLSEPSLLLDAPPATSKHSSLPRFGIGVKAGTLGFGVEAATAVLRKANVRVGFNDASYSQGFSKDGILYGGKLQLRSLEAHFDYYLLGGFHISPGALLYNGNKGTATASVPGGQSFSLGSDTYYSDAADPMTGTGTLDLNKAAPMVTFGFGNLLPRSSRHFSVSTEFGVVFQGSPKVGLNFSGSTCDSTGTICTPSAGNSMLQSDITSEEAKINKSLKPFQYYPVVSIGFGWKF
jgi:hypothetical protein